MRRSVTAEIDLEEAGEYSVLVKITAIRDHSSLPVETVIRDNCKNRRDKLLRIGLAYDLAHAKGQLEETEGEKLLREKAETRQRAKELAETKAKMIDEKKKAKKALKKKAKREKKAAEKAARKQAKKASKAAKKMVVQDTHDNCEQCKAKDAAPAPRDNAAAAAEIARPGEPDNMKHRNSDDCEECKTEEPTQPQAEQPSIDKRQETGEGNIDDESRPEISRSGSVTSNQDTSATREQEDPAAHDIAGELSKNVSFGDPMNNRMPCGFPESARHSMCDNGESNNSTGNDPFNDPSRRPSQQNEAGQNGSASITASSAVDADAQVLSSPAILDFASPNFRPVPPERTAISDIGPTPPAPLPFPQPHAQDDDDSDSDSDVSSVCSSAAEEVLAKSKAPPPPESPKTEEQKKKEEEEEDEFEKDPWNAVCVVGLRVYAKALVKTEINGETHWHRDRGCACDDKAEDDVGVDMKMEMEELKEEIEKEVWTPTTDDEAKQQVSLEHTSTCRFEENSSEFESKPEEQNRKRRVTIRREEEPVEVTIRVVRPNSWEDGEASLDVDDSAMDATKGDGGDGKGKRHGSIMGIRGRLGSVIVKQ